MPTREEALIDQIRRVQQAVQRGGYPRNPCDVALTKHDIGWLARLGTWSDKDWRSAHGEPGRGTTPEEALEKLLLQEVQTTLTAFVSGLKRRLLDDLEALIPAIAVLRDFDDVACARIVDEIQTTMFALREVGYVKTLD